MHSRAKVYQRKRPDGSLLSPYYHAWFLVWDAQQQRWKPKTVSTHASDPAKALEIAKEFERLALAAGGGTPAGQSLASASGCGGGLHWGQIMVRDVKRKLMVMPSNNSSAIVHYWAGRYDGERIALAPADTRPR
jgi:hypothetical protein